MAKRQPTQALTLWAEDTSALQVVIQSVETTNDYERLPDNPGVWYETALSGKSGAKRAEYREPVTNLAADYLAAGITVSIGLYQGKELLLDCRAYEPIKWGRQLALVRCFPLSAEGYAAARDLALSWLPGAQRFVAHALGLAENADAHEVFSAILRREDYKRMNPHVTVPMTPAGLSRWDAWPDEARILRALVWLQAQGYVGRVGDEWQSVEWLAQKRSGVIA